MRVSFHCYLKSAPLISLVFLLRLYRSPTATVTLDLQGGYGLKFDQTALVFGMMANGFAAVKGQENAKIMKGPGLRLSAKLLRQTFSFASPPLASSSLVQVLTCYGSAFFDLLLTPP